MTLNRDFDLDCLIVSNFLKLNPDYKNCEFIPINGWKYFCSKLHDKGGDFCLFSSFLKKEVNCSILPLITFSWEIIQISTAVYKMCWFFKKIFFVIKLAKHVKYLGDRRRNTISGGNALLFGALYEGYALLFGALYEGHVLLCGALSGKYALLCGALSEGKLPLSGALHRSLIMWSPCFQFGKHLFKNWSLIVQYVKTFFYM